MFAALWALPTGTDVVVVNARIWWLRHRASAIHLLLVMIPSRAVWWLSLVVL